MTRMRAAAGSAALMAVFATRPCERRPRAVGREDHLPASARRGTGFGPQTDFIDVEVVVQINTKPGESYGFQLRNDANRAARQGMLDLFCATRSTPTRRSCSTTTSSHRRRTA